jgi:hypothetical protein
MIDEAELGRFPAQEQGEIRQAIRRYLDHGYPARYLELTPDDCVVYDRESAAEDASTAFWAAKLAEAKDRPPATDGC